LHPAEEKHFPCDPLQYLEHCELHIQISAEHTRKKLALGEVNENTLIDQQHAVLAMCSE
jgi:hypothetical protein